MCFIIDPDGKCASGRVEKFQQDCSARGYTQTCDGNGQVGVGDSCDGKYKKCECRSEYRYTDDKDSKYEYKEACTDSNNVTKYKYRICQSKYRYVSLGGGTDDKGNMLAIGVESRMLTDAVKLGHPLNSWQVCGDNSDISETNVCVEEAAGVKRSTRCVCDTSVYKYTKADEVAGAIVVGGNTCRGSDGVTRYEELNCSGTYQDTCNEDLPGWKVSKKTSKDLTCKQCTKKTCSQDYSTADQLLFDTEDLAKTAITNICKQTDCTGINAKKKICINNCAAKYEAKGLSGYALGDTTNGTCYEAHLYTCSDFAEGGTYYISEDWGTSTSNYNRFSCTQYTEGFYQKIQDLYVNNRLKCGKCERILNCDKLGDGWQFGACGTGFDQEDYKDLGYGQHCYKCVEKIEKCEDYGLSSNLKPFHSTFIGKTLSDGTICFNTEDPCYVGDIMFNIKLNQSSARVNNVCAAADDYEDIVYTRKLGTLYPRQDYTKEEIVVGIDWPTEKNGEFVGVYLKSTLPVSFSVSGDTVTAMAFDPSKITLVTKNEMDKAYIRIDGTLTKLSNYLYGYGEQLSLGEEDGLNRSAASGYGPAYFSIGSKNYKLYKYPEDIIKKNRSS